MKTKLIIFFLLIGLVVMTLLVFQFNENTQYSNEGSERGSRSDQRSMIGNNVLNKELVRLNKNASLSVSPNGQSTDSGVLTPEEALLAMEKLRLEVPDLIMRGSMAMSIVSRLCLSGYSAEAWDLIEPGFGVVRDLQLEAYFKYSNSPDKIEKLNELEGDEYTRAFRGLIGSYEYKDLLEADFESLGVKKVDPVVVAGELSMRLTRGGIPGASDTAVDERINRDILVGSAKLVSNGILRWGDLQQIMKNDKALSSLEKIKIVDDVNLMSSGEISSRDLDSIRSSLLETLTFEDPNSAFALIGSNPNYSRYIPTALVTWLSADNSAANDWVIANFGTLDVSRRNLVAETMAKFAEKHGDSNSAQNWKDQIVKE